MIEEGHLQAFDRVHTDEMMRYESIIGPPDRINRYGQVRRLLTADMMFVYCLTVTGAPGLFSSCFLGVIRMYFTFSWR